MTKTAVVTRTEHIGAWCRITTVAGDVIAGHLDPHAGVERGEQRPWTAIVIVCIIIAIASHMAVRGTINPNGAPTHATGNASMQAVVPMPAVPQSPAQVTVAPPRSPDLEVVDWKRSNGEYGVQTITGTVKNNTGRQYSYVQIEYNLYDFRGNQVGSTLANCNNLEAHGTWKFSAVVPCEHVDTAKCMGVTAF